MEKRLEIKGVTKTYIQGDTPVIAIDNVTMEIVAGEITSVVGRSGSGKSTLLHMMGGLDKPDQGEIIIDGTSVYQLSDKKLTAFRNQHIGFVFQRFHLIEELSVLENIRLPLDLVNRTYDLTYEKMILELLQMEDRLRFFPRQLSGGQQQKVAIARALITKPDIILADEPTGNLDRTTGELFFDFIRQTNTALKQTYVIVTHNMDLARRTDRILTLDDGRIVCDTKQGGQSK
ncbi:MAG: ABC transporter ATP-binding protein [Oscillospiraceae bacterium]|jgi:putative ABC transport system ATP-binding protein|nr:ABC transporter ATP-binding protein [Oscillospiraceae bacterium]